jgi:biopolymer transport protein TolR
MSMNVGNKKGPRGEINVTPLIDVVLVLLIIFMVLTPSTLKHLTPTVPRKADDSTPQPPGDTITVEYSAKRELSLNGEAVAPEELANKLKERLSNESQKVVFFKAEDDAPYGEVIHLMDLARGAGAQTLAVITK